MKRFYLQFKLGMIIYINGPSSAGKTSISNSIKQLSEKPIVSWSVDTFMELIDDKFYELDKKAHIGCKFIQSEDAEGYIVKIEKGELWKKIYKMMIETIYNFSVNGFDVVVDDCSEEDHDMNSIKERLSQHNVFFIKVYCPISVLNERELKRGDGRILGTARGTMENINKSSFKYDLMVDTSTNSPIEIAKEIIKFVGL